MKRRNPQAPQRHTRANERKTEIRIEQYYGKVALLNTWEAQPSDVQLTNHDYIVQLRANVRQVRAYVLHRADPNANI